MASNDHVAGARPPAPVRRFGAINALGLRTLIGREVHRFIKVYTQTLVAPVVTTLLLLAVFALALGGIARTIAGRPFAEFIAPGLIMMAMMQNAFANTSSSIMISKVQGNIVDTLLPPLSPFELLLGFALGGVLRALAVGAVVALCLMPFVAIRVADPALVLFHGLSAALLLSLLGIAGAVWAEKFDHIAAVTNFIVTPLSFLSGTFYTVELLPSPWHAIALANPFFYMLDGFRAGFIGHHDAPLAVGIAIMLAANAALLVLCHAMLARGYKLRG